MRKLLREHYKELLKEEIDFSSKRATIYHLTGTKTAQYDPVYAKQMTKTDPDLKERCEHYDDPQNLAYTTFPEVHSVAF